MDYYEFNRRALAALNKVPRQSRLRLLHQVARDTKKFGYEWAVHNWLPTLERGAQCQDAGEQKPVSGPTATLF